MLQLNGALRSLLTSAALVRESHLFGHPIGPQSRIAARKQRRAVEYGVHKVPHTRQVNVRVSRQTFASAGIDGTSVDRGEGLEQNQREPRRDRQVAERVCDLLGLSLATPIQSAVIQHDAAGNLLLDFWHANGWHRVTVLEQEGRLRVEVMRNSVWRYLGTLHATTAAFHSGDWRMQLWADYNEFAMWGLMGMIATGAYLWLSRRARHRWAMASLAAGMAVFAAMWVWTR